MGIDSPKADEPERQGPQVEQEAGPGKKGIGDQSDPADWTKKESTLFNANLILPLPAQMFPTMKPSAKIKF